MSKQKEVHVKFVSNSKDVIKDAKKVKESVDDVAKSTENVGDTGGKSFSKLKGGLNKVKGGFRAVGTAIKASGIGLLVTVIGSIIKGFQRSEKSQILFAKLMNNINAVLQPALDLITGMVEGVLEFVTSGEKLSQFATNFKNFVLDRVQTALSIFGSLGAAIKDLVAGDFQGALDNAKKAGSAYVELTIGTLKKGADAVTNAVKKSATEFNEQVKSNLKDLDRLNELEGTIFQKKRDRELEIADLRRISEDARFRAEDASNKNLEERFKAQDEALAAEQKIADLRIAQASDELELLRLKNAQGDSSREDKEAELALEMEILAAQQEKASRMKEVRNQQVSLRKEAEANAEAEKAEELAQQQKFDEMVATTEQEKYDLEIQRIRDKYALEMALYGDNEEKKQQLKDAMDAIIAEKDAQRAQVAKDEVDAEAQAKSDTEQKLADEKKALQMSVLDNAAQIFGQDSKMAKAVHLLKMGFQIKEMILSAKAKMAESVVDGADAAKEAAKANQKATSTLNPLIIAATAVASVAGLISTMKAVTAKKSAASKMAASVGGGAGGGSSASRPAPPSFNVIGATSADSNLIADSIDSKNNEPVKAYVVESEISAKQKAINEARKLRTL